MKVTKRRNNHGTIRYFPPAQEKAGQWTITVTGITSVDNDGITVNCFTVVNDGIAVDISYGFNKYKYVTIDQPVDQRSGKSATIGCYFGNCQLDGSNQY